jgi:hypothetical protein
MGVEDGSPIIAAIEAMKYNTAGRDSGSSGHARSVTGFENRVK